MGKRVIKKKRCKGCSGFGETFHIYYGWLPCVVCNGKGYDATAK